MVPFIHTHIHNYSMDNRVFFACMFLIIEETLQKGLNWDLNLLNCEAEALSPTMLCCLMRKSVKLMHLYLYQYFNAMGSSSPFHSQANSQRNNTFIFIIRQPPTLLMAI